MTEMKATPAVLRSLRIFKNADEPLRPSEFAWHYFPRDHPIWKRRSKCGPKGTTRGQVPAMWAGGWLGKLRRAGLIHWSWASDRYGIYYVLLSKGEKMLRENQGDH